MTDRSRRFWLHLWDALVWALVAFPVFLGGVRIREPGFRFKLIDPLWPVFALALGGWVLTSGLRVDLGQASSVRVARAAWGRWCQALVARPGRTLLSGAAVAAALLIAVSVRRHWSFESFAYDLGIFTQGLWNLAQGNGYYSSVRILDDSYSSVRGVHLLTDHQSFLVWLILPVFRLFPVPETLLVVQGVGIALGGISVYAIARQYLVSEAGGSSGSGTWVMAALPLLYWAYYPMRNANTFDFHPETLMLPLLLAAIAGLQSGRARSRALGGLALGVGMLAKETAPVMVMGMGLAWALGAGPLATRGFTRKLGWVLMPLGLGAFAVDLKLVPGWLGGSHYHLQAHLDQYGGTLKDFVLSPVLRPEIFWGNLLGPARQRFLFLTLAPLAFIPLLSWRTMLVAVPGYAMLFLTAGEHKVEMHYHYATEPAIGLFWGCAAAVSRFQKKSADADPRRH